jgi:alcohol dehydrogenase class IV
MVSFEFATAARIVFGAGKLRAIGPMISDYGRRAMVVTGRNPERASELIRLLEAEGIRSVLFPLNGEPTLEDAREGVVLARSEACDFVAGFGGGSALDAAKAVAALLTNPGDLLDYLEVIGRAQPLSRPAAPCLLVPTTAGTGAEVTRNAVLTAREQRVKVSLRSPFLLPRLALVDPELTFDLPPGLTASTGLDALTQLIEPFVSPRANPVTDSFCREGIPAVARSLKRAHQNGRDAKAREEMSLASLLGGLSLANAGLGAVHGFAAPLGGACSAPHGGICAALLPAAMEVNVRALEKQQPQGDALQRYSEVARLLTGKSGASAMEGSAWVRELCGELDVPPLREYGFRREDFSDFIEKASRASSMKGNPVSLTSEELREILELSF